MQNLSFVSYVNHYVDQSLATLLMMSGFRRYIAEYTVANSWRYPIRRRVIFASAGLKVAFHEKVGKKLESFQVKSRKKVGKSRNLIAKSRNKFDKLTKTSCTYLLTLILHDSSRKLQSQDIRAVLLQETLRSYYTCCCQPEIFLKFIN